jgi:hypothetical protein
MIGADLRATSAAGDDGPGRRLGTSNAPTAIAPSRESQSRRTGMREPEDAAPRPVGASRVRPGRSTSP